ncbi:tyrosine-type recombinase/integrase [Thermodesulfobacteriota bacterium]
MPILAQCPCCKQKQSLRNKKCKCGENLDKAKGSRRVKYWIDYRLPDGTQRRQNVDSIKDSDGYSIGDARDALAKRRVQKKENRVFDMLPESDTTFGELTEWYLDLDRVKKLRSYVRVNVALTNFNAVFKNKIVNDMKHISLENYQERREEQGLSPATIDMEISIAKTMITKAFYNDMVAGRILKAFNNINKKLKKGANVRKRTLTIDEYKGLILEAKSHLKAFLIIAFNTGMRRGEIRQLKWSYIDRKNDMIRLPPKIVKEGKGKAVPVNHHVEKALKGLPRALKHDFVITYKGQPIRQPGGLNRSFRTACKDAGVPFGRKADNGITIHDIRRTVKTNMLIAGVDKVFRDTILGHSLQGMDAHYISLDDKALKNAMGRYTAWLDDQLKLQNVDQSVDQIIHNQHHVAINP